MSRVLMIQQTVRHRELAELVFSGGSVPKFAIAMMQPSFCGKWTVSGKGSQLASPPNENDLQVLDTLLKDWKTDRSNKVLIFTKSVKLLDMLEFHLGNRGAIKLFMKSRCAICSCLYRLRFSETRWIHKSG